MIKFRDTEGGIWVFTRSQIVLIHYMAIKEDNLTQVNVATVNNNYSFIVNTADPDSVKSFD